MRVNAAGGLRTANLWLERWMVLLTPLAMVVGWAGRRFFLPCAAAAPWLLALMTLALSLGTSWADLRRVTAHPFPAGVALALLHFVAPLYAWLAWRWFFAGSPDVGAGLVLATAIPIGVSSLLWTSLAGGDVPLALTLVAADTLVSPLLLPVTIRLFAGRQIAFAAGAVVQGLLHTIVLPTVLGVTSHDLTAGRLHRLLEPYAQFTAKASMILSVLLSVANSASRMPALDRHYLPALFTLAVLSVLGYLSAFAAARLLGWRKPVAVSLAYCTGLRNTVAGTVVAATYFPPRVALTVCLMMLFQQPLAGLIQRLAVRPSRFPSAA